MIVVVPPHAADRVPVRKSSAIFAGPSMAWSRWQCASTPPGVTVRPAASISRVPAGRSSPSRAMRPARMPMSQPKLSLAVATRALRITRSRASAMPAASRHHGGAANAPIK
jgi:hypothetical protein